MSYKTKRTSINIVNSLKKMIVSEDLKKLPGEIELSKEFNVSRTVIREALKILEYEGIIRIVHGSGSFVIKSSGFKITFNVPFEINTDDPKNIVDLLEVRRGLELTAIKLAINNAPDYEINELEERLLDLEEAIQKGEPQGKVDAAFHKKIFEITKNKLLYDVFITVFNAIEILWKSPLGMDSFGDKGLPFHRPLFEEIKNRNMNKAIRIYNKIIDLDLEDIEKGVD
jgi:GntR family transcriptional repressor for pyruvate dehydrogenase complex